MSYGISQPATDEKWLKNGHSHDISVDILSRFSATKMAGHG
jgi:hypothetical protein